MPVECVEIQLNERPYTAYVTRPAETASLEELQQALSHNRNILQQCQTDLKNALKQQLINPLIPLPVNTETPTQMALTAHVNITLLIPLILLRGGEASFEKSETLPPQQRIELLHKQAAQAAQKESFPQLEKIQAKAIQAQSSTLPQATLIILVVILLLLIFSIG